MQLRQAVELEVQTTGADSVKNLAGNVGELNQKLDQTQTSASRATGSTDQFTLAMNRLERQIIITVVEFASFKSLLEGIKGADALRDLQTSIDGIAGSAGAGAQAMRFFEEQTTRTRATAEELSTVYRKLYVDVKNGMGAAFDPKDLQAFTVALSQAATATGLSLQEIQRGFDQILRGKAGGRGGFLELMGLEDTGNAQTNLDNAVEKVKELAKVGEEMGQTFESTFKHIGATLTEAFAEGFGAGQKGYDSLYKAFTSPDILNAVKNIGEAIKEWLPAIGQLAKIITNIATIARSIGGFSTSTIGNMGETDVQDIPGANNKQFNLTAVTDKSRDLLMKKFYNPDATKDMQVMAQVQEELQKGLDANAEGVDRLSNALKGLHTIADTSKKDMQELKAEFAAMAQLNKVQDQAGFIEAGLGSATSKQLESEFKAEYEELTRLNNEIAEKIATGASSKVVDTLKQAATVVQKTMQDIANEIPVAKSREWELELEKVRTQYANIQLSAQKAFDTANRSLANYATNNPLGPGAGIAAQGQDALDASFAQFQATTSQLQKIIEDQSTDTQKRADAQKEQNLALHDFTAKSQESARMFLDAARQMDEFSNKIGGILVGSITNLSGTVQGIVSNSFQGAASMAGSLMASVFGSSFQALTPGAIDAATGKPMTDEQIRQHNDSVKKNQDAMVAGIGAVVEAVGVLNGSVKQSAAATILSFTSLGATIGSAIPGIGTAIGAVVGLVVGAVIAAFAPPVGKDYPAAAGMGFGPDGFHINTARNITTDQLRQMTEGVNKTVNEYYDAFIGVLIAVGSTTLPNFTDIVNEKLNPVIAAQGAKNALKGEGGTADFGYSGSAQWMDWFNRWLNDTLPKNIAEAFKGTLEPAFENMGMTVGGFNKLWHDMQGLDPKDALAWLSDVATALYNFKQVQSQMDLMTGRGSQRSITEALFGGTTFTKGGELQSGVNDFIQSIRDAAPDMTKMAEAVMNMVGPDQAKAAVQLSQSMGTMMSNLISYVNQLISLSKQLSQSIADQKDKYILAGFGTDAAGQKAKNDYLTNQLAGTESQIQNAAQLGLNAQDVAALVQKASNIIDEIYQMDPTKNKDWALNQLNALDAIQKQAFASMANQASAEVSALMATLKPAVDEFQSLGTTADTTTTNVDNLGNAADHAGNALNNFANDMNDVANAYSNVFGGGGDTGEVNNATAFAPSRYVPPDTNVTITVADPGGYVRQVQTRRISRQR